MTAITAEIALNPQERAHLRAVLACGDDVALDAKLALVAKAALNEHLDMFLGQAVFTRGSDFKEYRLALLTLHAFSGQLPEEGMISRMFQITRAASRGLLRAMLSKYQIRLDSALKATLQALLLSATPRGPDRHSFVCRSPALVYQLNQRLVDLEDPFAPVTPLTEEAGRYVIDNASLAALKAAYGL
jgi:hypothetical protein